MEFKSDMKSTQHGGDIWTFANGRGISVDDVYDFSVNTYPFDLPSELISLLCSRVGELNRYPDIHCRDLTAAVAGHHALAPGCVVPANGSIQIIFALCSQPYIRRVVTFEPGFIEYRQAADAYKKEWQPLLVWYEEGLLYDLTSKLTDLHEGDLVFIGNPANPAGHALGGDEIAAILRVCEERNAVLVVDEAFIEFSPACSVASLAGSSKNLVVLRSLTKYFGLAGLRLGYALANPTLADRLALLVPPWSVNTLAQEAGRWVIDHRQWFDEKGGEWLREKERLYSAFCDLPNVTVYPSVTSYFLIRWHTKEHRVRFQEFLAQRNILLRNCGNYIGLDGRYIRISARLPEQNARLIELIQSPELHSLIA